MSSSDVFPVQVLREHVSGLEAAISVCLTDAGHKPVHKLRTETRRVEALLLLLAAVPGMPEHRAEAATLLRALSRLRRAAGKVRDFDVQRKMLEGVTEATDAPALSVPEDAAVLGKAAGELRKHMARARDRAATDLQDLLGRRQAKTAGASEALLKVLQPAQELAVPSSDLLHDAQAVLTRDGLLGQREVSDLTEDELHTVRKAAKAARYLAESLPDDPALVQAAQRFEALQEAGGQWHDTLELTRAARRYFSKSHELTALYREQRNRKLELYRAALQAQAQAATPAPSRKAPKPTRKGKPTRTRPVAAPARSAKAA